MKLRAFIVLWDKSNPRPRPPPNRPLSLYLGVRDQGNLARKRCLQLRNRRLGGTHEKSSLGGPASRPGHLPAGGDERRTPRDPRRRPPRHRRSYSGMLVIRASGAARDV